jgi:hypothetical protein
LAALIPDVPIAGCSPAEVLSATLPGVVTDPKASVTGVSSVGVPIS